jgi:hypothetical protein
MSIFIQKRFGGTFRLTAIWVFILLFLKDNKNNIIIKHLIGAEENRKRRRAERKVPTCYVGIERSRYAGEQN